MPVTHGVTGSSPVRSAKLNQGGHNEHAGRNVTNQDREERKKLIGSRKQRKLKKYSDNFNEIFTFFLKGYRSGLLTFCGDNVDVKFDVDGEDGKYTFKRYDNGEFKGLNRDKLSSRHSNIVKGVIIGKKSWGLFLNEWTDGIAEGLFTTDEILNEFKIKKIKIPDSLLLDFKNNIQQKIIKRYF